MFKSATSRDPEAECYSTPFSYHTQPQQICASCGKPRSRSYHINHPVRPGEQPRLGVCSRPHCSRSLQNPYQLGSLPDQVIAHEVHHYYHGIKPNEVRAPRTGFQGRLASTQRPDTTKNLSSIAELPGNDPKLPGPNAVYGKRQSTASAPHVDRRRKPVFLRNNL